MRGTGNGAFVRCPGEVPFWAIQDAVLFLMMIQSV